jgi:hypothetical protein
VTGYQVCVGNSSLSCNAGLAPVSAATSSYTFAPTAGVLHFVAVRATNAAGSSPFSSEVSFSIPSFAQPANQSGVVGSAVSPLTLSITDPDGSARTITHTGLPVGLSIDSATLQITGTPTAAGDYDVTVFVNDGLVTVSRSFTWVVTNPPVPDATAPLLEITSHVSSQTVSHSTVTLTGIATDSGRGENGVARITVNGATVTGATASGSNAAYWTSTISLSVGVNTITVEATDAAGNVGAQQITLTRTAQVCRNIGDVNGDCSSDLIWNNSATGHNFVWYLNGTTAIGGAYLPGTTDPDWQPVTSADINQDGTADLIWRNRSTGQNVVWYLRGTMFAGAVGLPTVADLSWQLVASSDINRDGSPDLIWRNSSTGQNIVWYLNGATVVGSEYLFSVPDIRWQLVASADVNQDGAPDLIWRNSATGENRIWYLQGASLVGDSVLPDVLDPNWRLMAALDIDNNGRIELIWRHSVAGHNFVWYLDQTTVVGGAYLPSVGDQTWQLIGAR